LPGSRASTSPPPLEADESPVSFLVDYDGTISLIDIGDELLARHFGDAEEIARKDELYDAGLIGSRELMAWDMDVLPDDAELLRREAAAMPQDPHFAAFVAAAQARGAHVEVVSDGLGFYVASNLAALVISGIAVATNENQVHGGGAGMSFPYGHPSCFVCGTCKRERVRLHQAAGRVVVFVGEGTSDRYGAAHADLVFAKDNLVGICEAFGWPYQAWHGFDDLAETVERLYANGELPATTTDLQDWRASHGRPPAAYICGPEVWGPDRSAPPGSNNPD
jgi:2-hydroxy-3-keto-5-methylthiopentenyl-1-phosphate phosphatase